MRENDTDGGNEDLDQGPLPRMRENLPYGGYARLVMG